MSDTKHPAHKELKRNLKGAYITYGGHRANAQPPELIKEFNSLLTELSSLKSPTPKSEGLDESAVIDACYAYRDSNEIMWSIGRMKIAIQAYLASLSVNLKEGEVYPSIEELKALDKELAETATTRISEAVHGGVK